MTAEHAPSTAPRRRRWRTPYVVAAAVTALFAFGSLAAGGVALVADGEKDETGYLATDGERFFSGASALVSENLDVDLDGAEWLIEEERFGNVRLEVDSSSSAPVFVGVGRTEDVREYLRDVAHSTLTDVGYDPFSASYDHHGGDRKPAPPANAPIWTESASGTGRQSLTWDVDDGDWSIVVMNADGSSGVEAEIAAGAELPWLDDVGWIGLGGGTLLMAIAGGLLALGSRRPPSPRAGAPRPSATPAAA